MKEKKNIIIVILVIVVLILGFLYLTDKKTVEYVKPETVADTVAVKDVIPAKISTTEKVIAKSCAETLSEELKKDNVDYEKGSVIVSFLPSVSLGFAKEIFQKAGVQVIDESFVDQNFATTHRMTGQVSVGQELTKVCLLREDSNVKYAGVNELFTLHE